MGPGPVVGQNMEHPRGQLQMDHQYGLGEIFVHILQLYWWVPWEKTHLGVLGNCNETAKFVDVSACFRRLQLLLKMQIPGPLLYPGPD